MICSFCETTIFSPGASQSRGFADHQDDPQEFLQSIEQGEFESTCIFCSRLATSLRLDDADLLDSIGLSRAELCQEWFSPRRSKKLPDEHGREHEASSPRADSLSPPADPPFPTSPGISLSILTKPTCFSPKSSNPIPDTLLTRSLAPVFRWIIRPAAKIDEMPEHAILTFRPAPNLAARIDDRKLRHVAETARDVVFYLLREDELEPGEAPSASELPRSTAESWRQITSWLDECASSHTACQIYREREASRVLPTRLLDLQSSGGRIRVVHTADFAPEERRTCRYVTLSHSWGQGEEMNEIKLLDENLGEYTTAGVLERLFTESAGGNRNFAHAIEVARRLGVRYVWIDSLCIIQNSKNGVDWDREAPRMHEVYRGSWCNVGAANSTGRSGGLFRSRREAFGGQSGARVCWRGARWRVVPEDLWDRDLLGEVLYKRGWVYQGESSSAADAYAVFSLSGPCFG